MFRKIINLLLLVLFTLMLNTVHASGQDKQIQASCYGSTCNSLNPHTMGCDVDSWPFMPFGEDNAKTMLKISPSCYAGWSLVKNETSIPLYLGASVYFNPWLTNGYHAKTYAPVFGNLYTPMGDFSYHKMQACGRLDNVSVQVPLYKDSVYCGMVYNIVK